ncbi:GNAT family N-acetyltransferase [Crossiella sp. NPDC003009]
MTTPRLIVLTGISAAGKTTVGRLLAESFPRGAFVEGDRVREMVRTGRADMSPDPGPDALDQLRLRYRQAAALADSFVAAGFTAVVEDVIIGAELRTFLAAVRSPLVHLVVLAPATTAVGARETGRDKTGYGGEWTVEVLDRIFREQTPRLGLWLDSSGQTPAETVREILDRLPESLLSDPPELLRTERLLLRRVRDADLPSVLEIQCDPAANEHNTTPPSTAKATAQLADWQRVWAERGIGYWAIVLAETGETIGFGGIAPRRISGTDSYNLYYRFRPSAWGKGYATEMATAAVDWAAEASPDRPVMVATMPDNTAAKRVAAKLGMVRVGITEDYADEGDPALDLFRRPLPAPEELHTERLWLRRLRATDLGDCTAIGGADATGTHAQAMADWAERGLGYWAICSPETGELLGYGGLRHATIDGTPALDLAYRFRASARGQGLAAELSRAAHNWAERANPELPVVPRPATDDLVGGSV